MAHVINKNDDKIVREAGKDHMTVAEALICEGERTAAISGNSAIVGCKIPPVSNGNIHHALSTFSEEC